MINVLIAVYLHASRVQLEAQREDVNDLTRSISSQMIQDGFLKKPYSSVLSFICEQTKEKVENNGWEIYDPDGVSWFLALYCESYSKFVNSHYSYDKVFSDCFRYYFRGQDPHAIYMKKVLE